MASIDLTVRGGGIFGLSIAWEAARRGARVRLIETARIGAGASGGIVGALSPHVPENWNPKKAFQLESLLMAEEFWAGVTRASGLPAGYGRVGRLQPLANAAAVDLARQRSEAARSLWQGRADWRVIPAAGGAWEPASASGWLVQDTLSARVHPRLATLALTEAIRSAGGDIVLGEAANEGQVIWATGLHGLRDLSDALGRRVGDGVRGQAICVRFDAGGGPQLFVDGLHVIPHADGTVAIGSTSEYEWNDECGTDGALETVYRRALAALPALAKAPVLERWAGVRPRAKSRAPLLGAWPGRAGHFVANGGFKIGFGMAPKVAEVMVDLVLTGKDAIPDGFRLIA